MTVEGCAEALAAAGLRPRTGGGVERGPAVGISSAGGGFAATGMVYQPLRREWSLSDDTEPPPPPPQEDGPVGGGT
eukprot:COSAG01_NODE_55759_length_323_cov_0.450893_1_plen_75_part_10